MAGNPVHIAQEVVKPLGLKDLRLQCRARGISPAGGRETLVDRLVEHMAATKDLYVTILCIERREQP